MVTIYTMLLMIHFKHVRVLFETGILLCIIIWQKVFFTVGAKILKVQKLLYCRLFGVFYYRTKNEVCFHTNHFYFPVLTCFLIMDQPTFVSFCCGISKRNMQYKATLYSQPLLPYVHARTRWMTGANVHVFMFYINDFFWKGDKCFLRKHINIAPPTIDLATAMIPGTVT